MAQGRCMDAADETERAYAAAAAEVRRARAAGETELRLNRPEFAALARIPEGVAGWRDLGRANLDGTQVADLSPLQGLPDLWSVSADGAPVTDLSPLRGMAGLRTLWLTRTGVRDLSPLTGMGSLEYLLLDDTAVDDLSPLRGLRSLTNLSLRGAVAVTDIAPLADPGRLVLLALDRTAVADIAAVAGMHRLMRLSLTGTPVQDLSPVARLSRLTGLYLSGSRVADLRPLHNLSLLAGDPVGELPGDGLHFRDTPATRLDPELNRLSRIDDAGDRGAQTLAYLRTLPAWPEPLDWLAEPAVPEVPAGVPAPLQVAVRDGVLQAEPGKPPQGLAGQGRQAIVDYLDDLADQRQRIGNLLPRLGRAMAALERTLTQDPDAMNAIAVGTQASRVIALSQATGDDLDRDDAADIRAFAAALGLFLDQLPDWRAYRAAALPEAAAVAAARPEVDAITDALRDRPAVDAGVADRLAALHDDLRDEPDSRWLALGLARSARNVVAALAGTVVSAWRIARREAGDIGARWWDGQKKALAGVGVVGTTALTAQAVGFFDMLGPRLLSLAQKLPAEFGWVAGFLDWLARVV